MKRFHYIALLGLIALTACASSPDRYSGTTADSRKNEQQVASPSAGQDQSSKPDRMRAGQDEKTGRSPAMSDGLDEP